MNKLIILDTNVLLSAVLFKKSEIRQLFDTIRLKHTIVVSDACFDEFKEVIYRPKFSRYIEPDEVALFLRLFREIAIFVPVTQKLTICRDPKDNKFLELALASNAHYIITGDQDLLVLNPFGSTQILSPANFLANF
jgi:uncharacterized protein